MQKMILLSRSEEIVLVAIWKLQGNAYGVTIREQTSRDTGHEWSFGAIYKPLKQLTHKHYVVKQKSDSSPDRGGRSKFLYSLTPDGTQALKEIRSIMDSVWDENSRLAFNK